MQLFNKTSALTKDLLLFTFTSFIIIILCSSMAGASLPGHQRAEAPLVSPSNARRILEMAPSEKMISKALGILSATEATSEITELAKGLKNDPDLIYEYVYNYIEYTPIFGSIKGAAATLADGTGNDFDQASLMIALLREADYTANFIYGVIRLDPDQITNWLGINNNINAIGRLLGSAGIPAQTWTYPGGSLAYVDVDHVWVKVNIEGIDYVFDPSFKEHTIINPVNLASAMGYDQSAFLSNALSGTTINTDYLQNVNNSNIGNTLTAYADNLINHIKDNHPGADLKDITGGKVINQLSEFPRQTALPYQQSITYEWTEIPSQYKTSFRIQHRGIDETFYSCDIYGKRLTIFYNESNQPVLRLDGFPVTTGSAAAPGTSQELILTVNHPYAANSGTYCDDSRTLHITAGGSYFVVNGWSKVRRGTAEKHRKILKENIHAGGEDTSEPVLGESLAMIAYTWLAECSTADELADQLAGNFTIHHHMSGVTGQNESPYIDMPMCLVSVVNREDDSEKSNAGFFSGSGHHSAFEWGVIDQLQPYSAVSTVKLIDISNNKSDKIFDATSSNYSSIKSQLKNYNSYELASVESYINAGYRVILPEDGNLGEGSWTGTGFLTIGSSENQIGHIISGGLSGGYGTEPGTTDPDAAGQSGDSGSQSSNHSQSNEPIDLVTGDYLYDHTDLATGSDAYPFGLEFKRSYNSGSRLDNVPLGLGWTHNFDLTAKKGSDGFQGLGKDSPIDAAAAIVEHFVSLDILIGSKTKERVVISTIAHRWFMNELIDNIVTVKKPGNTSKFLLLSNGAYNPPPGNADLLVMESDNSYLLTTKHGVNLDFDLEGKLFTWKDQNNNTVTFTYSSQNLQSVTNGLGRTLTFTYEGEYLSQVSDNSGQTAEYAYDATGNLTDVTDPAGNTTTFEYDTNGLMTKIFYPAHPSAPFVINTYNSLGKVDTQTDGKGNIWHYYFSGYRAEEINPLGNAPVWYFNKQGDTILEINASGHGINYIIDGHNRLVQKIFSEGNSIEYEYDENHNPVKKKINPKPASGEPPIIKSYTYEPVFNRLETSIDPLGNTTTFIYDSNGNLTQINQPETDGNIPQTNFSYNTRGQVETRTDAEGRTIDYTCDGTTGDLLSITIDKTGLNLTTQMTYDSVGNMLSKTDPNGQTTTFQYDNMRRLKQTTAPAPFNYITKYEYDANGNMTKFQRQTDDPESPWQTTDITYTITGKKETVNDPENHIITYQYDQAERLWKLTDAENNTTEYLYDATNRIYRVIDALGNISEEYTYTPNGQKNSLQNANSNTTLYEYDDFDRLFKTIYPDASYEQYSYDSASNLIQKRTRAGQMINYTFDPMNRLETKNLPGPETILYNYDLTGSLKNIIDSNGTISHDYDNAGRLETLTYPDGKTVGYAYDNAGNRTRLTYPDGYYITYSHDSLNRLTDVYEGDAALLAHYEHDALSRRSGLTYGNGTSTTYEHEIDNDLSSLFLQFNASSANLTYTYDNTGNRQNFTADDDRFIYSPLADINNAYLSNNLNQYTSAGGIPFAYDSNGNLTSDGINAYTYDPENRLITAYTPAHSIDYSYDPLSRRISKTVDSTETSYLYDSGQVIIEYDGSGQMIRRYVYGPEIDEPICMKTGTAIYYYHFNALGSVIALSNASGDMAETYAYSPYGKANQASNVGNPYLFTGRRYDPETGLYYYRARYYDSGIGRFLQVDPIGYAGGINLYGYVLNNPVNWVDPDGLFRFGKRPLNGAPWIPGASNNPLDDYLNTEISHEHGFFEDASGDNIGFAPGGRFTEDPTDKGYRYDDKHYDDDLMREALKNIKDGEYSLLGFGKKDKNNCQDWAERLRKEYNRLEKEDKSNAK